MDPELAQAKALADPTRLAIHRLVVAGPWPVDVATLTEAVGLHHTAVRQHLVKLREAGLVEEETVHSSGRGRPRLGYRPSARWSPADARYRDLAELLAESVRTGDGPREVGRRAGRRAGLAEKQRGPAGEPIEVLVREAVRLGFQPSRDGNEIVLGACPYADVAATDPATICSLHLGLAEGLAEAVGGMTVTHLVPLDPHEAGCRLGVVPTRRRH